MSRWPNFLLIGAGKSGTTSLYHYLRQHPEIFMSPVKEPKYFALAAQEIRYNGPGDTRVISESTPDKNDYQALFKGVRDEKAVGEASTIYLSAMGVAGQVAAVAPNMRLAAILRHPVDRAYSAWLHLRRDGFESLESFEEALAAEPERIQSGYYLHWHLRARGYYGKYLQTWYERFPAHQIRVYLYEDLVNDSRALMQDLFAFLGVDASFEPDVSARHNQSGVPLNQGLQNFLTKRHPLKEWLKKVIPERIGHRVISAVQPGLASRPALEPGLRMRLVEDFREDILLLQDLIGRDLSHWLNPVD